MSSSNSETRARVAWLVLMTLPAWACATAINNDVPTDSSSLETGGAGGGPSEGGAGSASAGQNGAAGGAPGAAGHGASGAPAHGGGSGGAPSGSAGKGGASSGGTGSGSAGKGGTGFGSAGKGGMNSGSAGKGGSGSGSAGASSAGASSAGASSGGTTSSGNCDAAHAVATLMTNQVYTGKANDCVRLSVNPGWSTIALQFQPMPGTAGYPVPFSYFSCGGNGTGSLTADYANTTFRSGPNPGCDFFVQFGGGATTIKVTYYD